MWLRAKTSPWRETGGEVVTRTGKSAEKTQATRWSSSPRACAAADAGAQIHFVNSSGEHSASAERAESGSGR